MEKIVVTPVYRGRLEESHERTRRAWRRRPWYQVTYSRLSRDASAYIDNNLQTILGILTYTTGAILVVLLLGIALRSVVRNRKLKHHAVASSSQQQQQPSETPQ